MADAAEGGRRGDDMKRAFSVFLLAVALVLAASLAAQDARRVVRVTTVKGMIHGGVTRQLEKAIDVAARQGAEALLIELDTPGGLLDATRDIVQKLLNAPVPVIVYVAPSGAHAGSAGLMITLAAHVAAMAPGTNIGAATPVSPQGEIPETMKKKVTNDTAAFVEAIAQQRKRNTDWAIKAVRDAVSVTDRDALRLRVIDLVAASRDDLLAQADGRVVPVHGQDRTLRTKGASVVAIEMGLKDRVAVGLANPDLAFVFLLVAILGLYVEFGHPGLIFPGAVGAAAGLLFLFSIQVLPFNYLGLLLIAIGITLFALELKFTSYGLLTAGGLACLLAGSLLLFDVPEKVYDPRGTRFGVPLSLVLPAVLTLGVFVAGVTFVVVRTLRRRVLTAGEGMIGEEGTVKAAIAAGATGQVFLHGELWRAVAGAPLSVGDRVRVVACRNLTVTVEKIG
jgi:membrane-bound serine protease (ClpP class)